MEESTSTPMGGASGDMGYGGTGTSGSGGSMTDQAKDKAREVVDQAKQSGGQLVDQAKQQIRSTVTTQKEQAAGSLDSVAIALRESVDNLKGQEQAGVANVLDTAAGAVENVSNYLRDHEVEDLVREVEEFGRRQPALFLGAAFALGFMAARFLKSTSGGYSGSYQGNGASAYSGSYYGGASTRDIDYGVATSPYTGASVESASIDTSVMRRDIGGTAAADFDDSDELADVENTHTTLP